MSGCVTVRNHKHVTEWEQGFKVTERDDGRTTMRDHGSIITVRDHEARDSDGPGVHIECEGPWVRDLNGWSVIGRGALGRAGNEGQVGESGPAKRKPGTKPRQHSSSAKLAKEEEPSPRDHGGGRPGLQPS